MIEAITTKVSNNVYPPQRPGIMSSEGLAGSIILCAERIDQLQNAVNTISTELSEQKKTLTHMLSCFATAKKDQGDSGEEHY